MKLKDRLIDLWLTQAGQLLTVLVVVLALLAPTRWLGFWPWVLPMLALTLGFIIGWAAARKHWRKRGYVPKL